MKGILSSKFNIFFLLFSFLIILFFIPLTFYTEKDGNYYIFSTGFSISSIVYDDEYKYENFIFYKKINFDEYYLINIPNSFIRFFISGNYVTKQKNFSTATVIYKENLITYENIKTNKEWIYGYYKSYTDFYRKYITFPQKLNFIFSQNERSFFVNPDTVFINSKKSIFHEINHYYFGNIIKRKNSSDIWPEILAEANSLYFLKNYDYNYYLNEISLKTINYYPEEYGKSVIDFLGKFDFDYDKILSFEQYIIKKYKKLDDKTFFKIIENGDDFF